MIFKIKNANPNQLMDEFVRNGIDVSKITLTSNLKANEHIAENVSVEFIDGVERTKIQTVIDNHVPKPLVELPSTEERIEQLENMILVMMEVM